MASCVRRVFMSVHCFVLSRCGFNLALFCNYKAGYLHGLLLRVAGSVVGQRVTLLSYPTAHSYRSYRMCSA